MNSDLRKGLEKFLAYWLELRTGDGSRPNHADEFRQAFLDELGERIDQFDCDQDWDKIFTDSVKHDDV